MTADRWTELEALAKAATPGPWDAVEGATSDGWWVERPHISTVVSDPTGPDARYIAAANPQTVLDLIAHVRELEAMRAKVLDVLDEIAALPGAAVIDAECEVVQPLRAALGVTQ